MAHSYVSNASKNSIGVRIQPCEKIASKTQISAEAKFANVKIDANHSTTNHLKNDKGYTYIPAGESLSFQTPHSKMWEISMVDSVGKEFVSSFKIKKGTNAIIDHKTSLKIGKKKAFYNNSKNIRWKDTEGVNHEPKSELSRQDSNCSQSGGIASVASNSAQEKMKRVNSAAILSSQVDVDTILT